jgi:type IX secretion system PorP/SprF family membrane protein
MKNLVFSLIIVLGSCGLNAQQDAMYTHYSFNTLGVNPAYAGSRDALTVTGLHRSQWVGFEGAPTTQTLTVHSPIGNDNLGLGLSIINDAIGPINQTSVDVDFAYRVKVNEKGKLALGLKGGINLMQGTLNTLRLDTQADDAFAQNIESSVLPNFGFGAYYYTTKWYIGLSSPKLLENDFKTNTTSGAVMSEKRHYFLIGGAVFNLKSDGSIKLNPTTLVKSTEAAPIEADITAMVIFRDAFELGAMYRTKDAVGLLLGYNFTGQIRFGYSFDWSFVNNTAKYNSGSHEVMLRYDFIYKNKGRIRSPRYF